MRNGAATELDNSSIGEYTDSSMMHTIFGRLRHFLIHKNGYYKQVPLKKLSALTGIPLSTLSRAALDERLEADRVAHVWIASPASVDKAIERGQMRERS